MASFDHFKTLLVPIVADEIFILTMQIPIVDPVNLNLHGELPIFFVLNPSENPKITHFLWVKTLKV